VKLTIRNLSSSRLEVTVARPVKGK